MDTKNIELSGDTVSMYTLPNVLIIGGPKCGTTSLFDWLAEHPEVCPSSMKETYYFMDSDNPMLRSRPAYVQNSKPDNIHDHGLSRYQQFFPVNSAQNKKIFLEATPHYLYQQTTPKFFSKINPQPIIIILLRQPSYRILSHFAYSQNNLLRIDSSLTFSDFTSALLANDVGRIRDQISDDQAYFWLSNQLKYSRYFEHIKVWLEKFHADRIMILFFEEMIADPRATLKQVATQLNINAEFYNHFDVASSNKTVSTKNTVLRRFLRVNKKRLQKIFPQLSGLTHVEQQLKSILLPPQSANNMMSQADMEAISRLDDYFRPHNQKLIDELGLNLDCWN